MLKEQLYCQICEKYWAWGQQVEQRHVLPDNAPQGKSTLGKFVGFTSCADDGILVGAQSGYN